MAGVRKPLTDAELAKAETEQNLRRKIAETEDEMEGDVAALAEAGDPDSASALAALRKALSGSTPKERLAAVADSVGVASIAAETPQGRVEDPEGVERVKEQAKTVLKAAVREERKRERETNSTLKAQRLLQDCWERWAREAKKNYGKACQEFIIEIGQNAVSFVKAGLFEDHLSVAAFIKQFRVSDKEGDPTKDDEYNTFYEKITAELRGEVMGDESDDE